MPQSPSLFDSPLPRWLAESPAAAGAASLYGAAVRFRNGRYDRCRRRAKAVNRPVISIGGIRAGGSGKTPAVMLLAGMLQRFGYQVAVLSRGYKRIERSSLQLAPGETAPWERIGDEPAMIRSVFPQTFLGIGADRYRSATLLRERMGARSMFLLDDGFQHRAMHRNLDIVCIHESIFSDRLLPQGFLREPVAALSRAQILFLICAEERIGQMKAVGERLAGQFPAIEQFLLTQKKEGWVNMASGEMTDSLPFENPVACCGIARPERFFDLVSAGGIIPCKKVAFPDHYHYTEYDFSSLRELYSQGLITTEKDAVRIRDIPNIPGDRLWYVKVRLQFAENKSLHRFNHYINSIDQ
ncbi:MAG: tetraacyldisaccharide 4'-kinase [Chitinispirillaceae bacterium]|nr:tetraacyldisaccharide 4'-kinase [Chitinispirillaceae bacterium]